VGTFERAKPGHTPKNRGVVVSTSIHPKQGTWITTELTSLHSLGRRAAATVTVELHGLLEVLERLRGIQVERVDATPPQARDQEQLAHIIEMLRDNIHQGLAPCGQGLPLDLDDMAPRISRALRAEHLRRELFNSWPASMFAPIRGKEAGDA
jgi:hypothetical protein